MNRQRKVVITVTYNELGVIVDTKAEEIDRKAVIDFPSGIANLDPKTKGSLVMYVMSLPDIQPERKTGKWVAVGERYVKCSECGLETTKNELRGIALFGKNEPYFCPNCGADMRGEKDE